MKGVSVLVLLLLVLLRLSNSLAQRQVYIVYVGEHSGEKTLREVEDLHHSYLHSVKGSIEEARASLVYSYKHIINGFSAFLTPDEATKLSEMEEVVSVFRSRPRRYGLQTTRSWDFVNLLEGESDGKGGLNHTNEEEELLQKANGGKNVIVGLLDTEEMEDFDEAWKLIGARYYLKGYEAYYGPLNEIEDYRSPRDKDGHGTHTASTVGGQTVANASALGGFAKGTASGGAPFVHLAIYKVCWAIPRRSKNEGNMCFDEDMLAAFDDAIADGVHVLSISIVPFDLAPYTSDGIAIGALHAVKRNIVVTCSGGNEGPTPSTVRNVAPWILTVGASSIDRVFSSPVVLGNGIQVQGQTVTPFKLEKMYPLVYAGDVEVPGTTANITGLCLNGTLSPELVEGKIVLCYSGYSYNVEKGVEVKRAGGAGFILQNPLSGIGISVEAHVLPATVVFSNDSATILNYIRNDTNPMATIVPVKTVVDNIVAPFMAPFSSTGPNGLDPSILKFLCNNGIKNVDKSFKCPDTLLTPTDLNYPSLAISELNGTMTVNRTVTNVGVGESVYNVTVQAPAGYWIEIFPTSLRFGAVGENRSFAITVKEESGALRDKVGQYAFGWYAWSDGVHIVRSPIAVSSA
ncbi:hypothetical protein RJ639_018418 [Escallonia herrerae]|uniref:Subtilisin-like protease SBT5.6 n=1 Tax=Escallonia herrerae TaxID=1293975 RepID=A0AA89AIX0_9ASTE|nr:hypothetical protein RJ639_018418 [Escallonia herrerae]